MIKGVGDGDDGLLTCVDLSAKAHDCLAQAGADDRAVLFLVVDYLLISGLDILPRGLAPRGWQG